MLFIHLHVIDHPVHEDSRGSQASLEVSQRLLGREEVVVLVLEVIELQVASSVHPEQLVSCGPRKELRENEEKQTKTGKKKNRLQRTHEESREKKDKTRGLQGKMMLSSTLKFFHSVVKCEDLKLICQKDLVFLLSGFLSHLRGWIQNNATSIQLCVCGSSNWYTTITPIPPPSRRHRQTVTKRFQIKQLVQAHRTTSRANGNQRSERRSLVIKDSEY